ncbi:MAG: poly(R)-hydroxyalkanoic acid synthase subunit PhaE [Bacteroidota bacterium]|nr:poly(R)-hydroxyalkanoic acid synthase subunit PhaE [Bacteroidota bacterium]
MKTSNPLIDTMIETQTQYLNTWMDSAKKMQSAISNGSISHEGQTIFKDLLEKQMSILNGMQQSTSSAFNSNNTNPQEFFKNWFNQQSTYAKQMADFNQSINNSFQSFGKPAQDYMSNFGQTNTAFTNIYNSWMNTLNSSFDTMSNNMKGTFNKDVFTNFIQASQMNAKMQEFFQPMAEAMKKGQFSMDTFKNYFTTDSYSNLTKQMFGNFYTGASLKEVYDNGMKQVQGFFVNNNNLGKDYFAQVQNMSKEFPNLFAGDSSNLKELYSKVNNIFSKTFEPLLKLSNPGKEKENVEATIALMDKMTEYSLKQSELQMQLQATTQKSIEKVAQEYADKFKDPAALTQVPNAKDMYNEWVKVNEQLFSELFATEEFSKVKAEALNLSMDVKKHFESQFEHTFENYPIVFKSEVEEMQKAVYELKKQVKDLQSKLASKNSVITEAADDDKASKTKKK